MAEDSQEGKKKIFQRIETLGMWVKLLILVRRR